MKLDAIRLEETRLRGLERAEDWPLMHERHRAFPSIFESSEHRRILDISASAGFAAKRTQGEYASTVRKCTRRRDRYTILGVSSGNALYALDVRSVLSATQVDSLITEG